MINMRKIERIKPFLGIICSDEYIIPEWISDSIRFHIKQIVIDNRKVIEEQWIKNQNWRFTQLLINIGAIPNIPGIWYYKEEYDWFKEQKDLRQILFWGTFEKDGEFNNHIQIAIKDMEIDHIKNCLTYTYVEGIYREVFEAELIYRDE